MDYWIDKDSSTDNVIVLTDNAIVVGSCDSASIATMEQQFAQEQPVLEVLGSSNVLTIPYAQLQGVISRSTDSDVDVRYRAQKTIEEKSLDFNTLEDKQAFITAIAPHIPQALEKSVYQQSMISAIISPLLSLIAGLSVSYLFYNKLLLTTLVIGGIWVLASVYMFFHRALNPPQITRWVVKGKHVRKAWSLLKSGFSYALLVLIAIAVAERFPVDRGPQAILDHLAKDELSADKVAGLVERGANINLADEEGDSPLLIAIYYGDLALVNALLHQGADLNARNLEGDGVLEAAIYNSHDDIIHVLLGAGAHPVDKQRVMISAIHYELSADTIQRLVEQGGDIHAVDDEGNNLIVLALQNDRDISLIQYLMDHGVETDITVDDMTLSDYAKSLGRLDVVRLLKSGVLEDVVFSEAFEAFIAEQIQMRMEKGKVALALINLADGEHESDETKALVEQRIRNNLYYHAIERFAQRQSLTAYIEACSARDEDIATEIRRSSETYFSRYKSFVEAGEELAISSVVIQLGDQRVLGSDLYRSLQKKADNDVRELENSKADNNQLMDICAAKQESFVIHESGDSTS